MYDYFGSSTIKYECHIYDNERRELCDESPVINPDN